MNNGIGFVVPTLGDRPDLLRNCISSLVASGVSSICIVAPETSLFTDLAEQHPSVQFFFEIEVGRGAARAINQGLRLLISAPGIDFISWLGDDDELSPKEFQEAFASFAQNEKAPLMIGACRYVDGEGRHLFVVRPKPWDIATLGYVPSRIPQPGCLFRSSVLAKTGLLDENLVYAFDHELFLRLKKLGPVHLSDQVVASYKWHADSLSSQGMDMAVQEGHRMRVNHGTWIQRVTTSVHILVYKVLRLFFSPRLS